MAQQSTNSFVMIPVPYNVFWNSYSHFTLMFVTNSPAYNILDHTKNIKHRSSAAVHKLLSSLFRGHCQAMGLHAIILYRGGGQLRGDIRQI
jgi:hypothetical protein